MNDDLFSTAPFRFGVRDRLLAMRSLEPFDRVDDEGAALLAEYSRIVTFTPGERVFSENGTVDSLVVVLEGRLRVPGSRGELINIGRGQPVGLLELFSQKPPTAPAVAVIEAQLLEVRRDDFFAILEENFSVVRSMAHALARQALDLGDTLPAASTGDGASEPTTRIRSPRTLAERMLDLSRSGIFVGAHSNAIYDIAKVMAEINVPAGHVFWRHGDTALTAIRILSGSVRCTDAHRQQVCVGPNAVLGVMPALASKPHAFEARAESEVSAYEGAFEDLLVVLEGHPELAAALLADLARVARREAESSADGATP
jgi:CRP-like cAMP-binding protein